MKGDTLSRSKFATAASGPAALRPVKAGAPAFHHSNCLTQAVSLLNWQTVQEIKFPISISSSFQSFDSSSFSVKVANGPGNQISYQLSYQPRSRHWPSSSRVKTESIDLTTHEHIHHRPMPSLCRR
jgi:hypothetical protein